VATKSSDVVELQIGVKHKPKSCDIQAHKGDRIKVHYRGSLTDGTIFDSSFERGDPIEFELGSAQVPLKALSHTVLFTCEVGWDGRKDAQFTTERDKVEPDTRPPITWARRVVDNAAKQ
ncbi:hypothetical protein KI387_036423, partial [Taxus chinensis]